MKNTRVFLKGKTILVGTVVSIASTILIVYLTGISSHRTLIDNSVISLSTLAIVFFCFLTIGLYKGLHITDDLSDKLKLTWGKSSILSSGTYIPDTPGSFDVGEGIAGFLISIALWLAMTLLFILALILLEFVLWAGIIGLIALIYWVLMRALKLIFAKSSNCHNNLTKSVAYGIGYTTLYLGWIYAVIFISAKFG